MAEKLTNFVAIAQGGGYASDPEGPVHHNVHLPGLPSQRPTYKGPIPGAPPRRMEDVSSKFVTTQARELGRMAGADFASMDAYSRHHKLISDYINFYGKKPEDLMYKPSAVTITDADVLRVEHRFVRTAEDDKSNTWEKRMAKKYYDKLFKEYCLADMSLYKEGKIGMRWRTEPEVLRGKGQFICGNKKCDDTNDLRSYEVNFAYAEAGERKQALVKLRLCSACAYKLNYRKIKEMEREERAADKRRQIEEDKEARKRRKAERKAAKQNKANADSSSGSGSGAADPAQVVRGLIEFVGSAAETGADEAKPRVVGALGAENEQSIEPPLSAVALPGSAPSGSRADSGSSSRKRARAGTDSSDNTAASGQATAETETSTSRSSAPPQAEHTPAHARTSASASPSGHRHPAHTQAPDADERPSKRARRDPGASRSEPAAASPHDRGRGHSGASQRDMVPEFRVRPADSADSRRRGRGSETSGGDKRGSSRRNSDSGSGSRREDPPRSRTLSSVAVVESDEPEYDRAFEGLFP